MTLFLLGLLLFLGVHSLRIVAEDWRTTTRDRLGANAWKGLYSVVSLAGFVMLVMGYGELRLSTVDLWSAPRGLRHLASLLTLFAFILLAAAYLPRSAIKARLRHPMTLAVKVWAFSHLLINARAADLALFGGFLLWSVLVFRAARARDRAAEAAGTAPTPVATSRLQDVLAVLIGAGAWAGFAFWGHAALIGIRPFS
jgi:uncharacterized membrane protein